MPFPEAGGAHRMRFTSKDAEERIEAVRQWFGDQGREEFVWWIGPSATPPDLEARLLARGAAWWREGVIASMLAEHPPPSVSGIDVRRVETYEEFVIARDIAWTVVGFTAEQSAEVLTTLPEKWEARISSDDGAAYLAYVDGKPAASADMLFLSFAGFLSGASTLPEHRSRGIYRALIRARWDDAVRRGTPALIVGAGAMSRPILERIGFRTVAEQHLLLDRSNRS